MRWVTFATFSFAVLIGFESGALAQNPDELIERGIGLRTQHEDEQALELFRQAYALEASPRALTQIALAEQALGLWVEAEEHLRTALETGDEQRDRWIRRRRSDLERAHQNILSRLGQLQVRGTPEGAEVRYAGRVLGRLPMAEPVYVIAGSGDLVVSATDHSELTRTVVVQTGQLTRETVELTPDRGTVEERQVEGPDQRIEERVIDAPRPPDENIGNEQRIAGWIAIGGGVLLAGGGIVIHVLGEGARSNLSSTACQSPGAPGSDFEEIARANCPSDASLYDASRWSPWLFYGLGAAAIGTGVVLLLTAPSPAPITVGDVQVECGTGVGDLGILCRGSF